MVSNDNEIVVHPVGAIENESSAAAIDEHKQRQLAVEETSEYYLRFAGVGR